MIDAKRLLSDCQALVRQIEIDLREELDERPELQEALKREHHEATVAKRTRRSVEEWTAERVTQAAAAWVLGCVFVRFLEDNALVDTPRLSGPGVHVHRARDEETVYFRQHPERTAREYLEDTFRAVAALPGGSGLFDERHNPIWQMPISGDAARVLLERWREINPQTGELVHDFTDPALETRFLGDLYQDLSETARKQYALLQTPEFIEEFILERTLEPAIDEFGLANVRLIDPACGSGHFLLGAFARLLAHWREREPGTDARALVERSLTAVCGVDLNPFAAAIARFRLLVVAIHACGVARLRDAPDLRPEIAVGDALLHGTRPGRLFGDADVAAAATRHLYATEEAALVARVLDRRYHVVVANPPYITPKDPALRDAYRGRFSSCHREYALTVPFMQLLFDLALPSENSRGAGYVGQITANSFMKREFGKKVIQEYLARVDLTLIVDTSGAYIPGHGTPTVILVGRSGVPIVPTVRTVMGVRGEPSTPANPAAGVVWTAIVNQVDKPGSESEYVTVEEVPRERYAKHPWSIGGGGASDLRERIEQQPQRVADLAAAVGYQSITGEDAAFIAPDRIQPTRFLIEGDQIRDWACGTGFPALWPYDEDFDLLPLRELPAIERHLWPYRELLYARRRFGTPMRDLGRPWYEWRELYVDKLRTPLSVGWAFVSTHNHFVLERGGNVLKQSAPVIKLPAATNEDAHLGLLGLLNSSTACFWFKQVCHNKGSTVDQRGARQRTAPFEDFFEFSGTKIGEFVLPSDQPLARARRLDALGQELAHLLPSAVEPTRNALAATRERAETVRAELIALQEELDWEVYGLYGLTDRDLTCPEPPPLRLGERAFEIVLARQIAVAKEQTTWFERHDSTPITEVPTHWPADYRKLVERRIALIESDRDLGLIERPECKRRWQWEPWEKQQEHALRMWLLDRLEGARYWRQPQLTSSAASPVIDKKA